MRFLCATLVAMLALSLGAAAQNEKKKPGLTAEALSPEQIAVYRAVLGDYVKDWKATLKLASETKPLDLSRPFFNRDCLKGFTPEEEKASDVVVHRLGSALAPDLRVVLVQPEEERETINADGLLRLSEIAFDREHKRALVSYSFVCGPLCGQGRTLMLKKVGNAWKIDRMCGGWIS